MNDVIEMILAHRSIRSFEEKPLSKEKVETIVKCAQAASTSSYMQAYSIIGVTDQAKKEKLAELSGPQSYVAKNGHFFVFCADLYRLKIAASMEETEADETLESMEKFMVACVDASLAAQNAALAAESMGLGICYIGGLRNHLPEVSEILETPDFVTPLFGMAVGYPANEPGQKPRLSMESVYHENSYQSDPEQVVRNLECSNRKVRSYYLKRSNGIRKENWTVQMTNMLDRKSRMYMKDFIEGKRLGKR